MPNEVNSIMICCFSCIGFCLIILSSITTCFGTDIANILAISFAISGAGLIVISCIVHYNCNNSIHREIYGNRHLENINPILHQEPLQIIRITNHRFIQRCNKMLQFTYFYPCHAEAPRL